MANSFLKIFSTSIGKKYIMAFAGLYLSLFLVIHLIGNLTLLANDNGVLFLKYAEKLESNIIIRINQVILYIALFLHFFMGIRLVIENKKARKKKYIVNNPQKNSSFAARYMSITAILVFLFIVLHLISFSIPHKLHLTEKNLYEMIVHEFSSISYTTFYVISMVFLSLHLKHGFQSAFQSIGINYPKYNFIIKIIAFIVSIIIPILFAFVSIFLFVSNAPNSFRL